MGDYIFISRKGHKQGDRFYFLNLGEVSYREAAAWITGLLTGLDDTPASGIYPANIEKMLLELAEHDERRPLTFLASANTGWYETGYNIEIQDSWRHDPADDETRSERLERERKELGDKRRNR